MLENLLLCLPPYILLILAAVGVWLFSRNIVPSDSYLVYEDDGWAARILLGAFSIWLLAPPIYERFVSPGVSRSRGFVVTGILLSSCWITVAAPVGIQHFAATILKQKINVRDIPGYLRAYLPERIETATFFPNIEGHGQFVGEMYDLAGVSMRPYTPIPIGNVLAAVPPETLTLIPVEYCLVASELGLPVSVASPSHESTDVGECTRYLKELISNEASGNAMDQFSASYSISQVSESIERAVGTLFVLDHLGSWRARSERPSTWLWATALALFWTATIQFGGDLGRKGIFAGLIPFWLDQLSLSVNPLVSRLQLDLGVTCALSLALVVIYIFWCRSRRYFSAFPWVQFSIGIISGSATVIYFEFLRPPAIVRLAEDVWYLEANLAAVFTSLALLLAIGLRRRRIASWAVAPVHASSVG
jgi:hypothetical protein